MKLIKILAVNLLIIVIILISYEFYCVRKWNIPLLNYYNITFRPMSADEYFSRLYNHETVANAFAVSLRREENTESDKAPIIIMGCSFARGFELKRTRTPSAILGKLTGRPVYNYGGDGWGLNQFLYQLRRDDFYKIKRGCANIDPEYVIYIIMQDHVNRIPRFKVQPEGIEFQPHFEVVNSHLVERKPRFYEHLCMCLDFQMSYNINKPTISYDRIKLYFEEAQAEIHKHWPNTKFLVLIYPVADEYKVPHNYLNFEEDLEKNLTGIKVINLNKLTGIDLTQKEYSLGYDYHPSSQAWDIIMEKLVKELKL